MNKSVLSQISDIRYLSNLYIEKELEIKGIHDLYTSHGSIIKTLYSHGPITMKELAKAINRDKSTLTVLVRKLMKSDYVSVNKSEEDGRVKIISLTEKANEIEDAFEDISIDLNTALWSGISNREARVFMKVLEKMNSNLISEVEAID